MGVLSNRLMPVQKHGKSVFHLALSLSCSCKSFLKKDFFGTNNNSVEISLSVFHKYK